MINYAIYNTTTGRILQTHGGNAAPGNLAAGTAALPIPDGTAWQPGTQYNVGDVRSANAAAFVCVTGGESAATGAGPSGIGTAIVDGAVTWCYYSAQAAPVIGYNTHQIASPGTATAAFVPYVATLSESQQAAIIAAANNFSTLIAAGFTFSGTLYQVDQASQASITAMGALAAASIANPATTPWPAGFYWVASNNAQIAMSAATMLAFAQAVALYVSGSILQLRAIKDSILAATTIAAVQAIDVTAGYPTPRA
jgi:hypothetical protein